MIGMKIRKRINVYAGQGLGNQLFVYAYIKNLLSSGTVGIVKIYFNRNSKSGFEFWLKNLINKSHNRIYFQLNNSFEYFFRIALFKIAKPKKIRKNLRIYYEKEIFVYEDELLKLPNHSFVFGNYINYKYVDPIFDELKDEVKTWLSEILLPSEFTDVADDSIILHVRRGDVSQGKPAAIRGSLSEAYYKKAIDFIASNRRFKPKNIIALTDDVKTSKTDLSSLPISYWFGPEEIDTVQSLKVFMNAKNFIGANSTLSWWGARLSISSPHQISILPRPWLGFKESKADEALHIPKVNYFKAE
jgi:hypothetical protein